MPNDRLRALLVEAGCTNEDLARMVRIVGAEVGLVLRCDRTTVSHWLSGTRPRGPVAGVVAEAMSRKLARPVAIVETGLAGVEDPLVDLGLREETDAIGAMVELARSELDPASYLTLRRCAYRLERLRVPRWSDAVERARVRVARRGLTWLEIDTAEVAATRRMANVLAAAVRAFGGGHGRTMLISYLATDVARWLRAHTQLHRHRDLLAVASDLTYLAGFMSFDDQAHGLAQRYYRVALRLAAAAEDTTRYSVVLRGLSWQASCLGHHRHALLLAEAAVTTAVNHASPRTRALLFGQLAIAYSRLGNRANAVEYLRTARRHLRKATSPPAAFGSCHSSEMSYQAAQVLAHLNDPSAAIMALGSSLQTRPPIERLARAISFAELAELHLTHGYLRLACTNWRRFFHESRHLQSGRVHAAQTTMLRRLTPHRSAPAARRVLQLANEYGQT